MASTQVKAAILVVAALAAIAIAQGAYTFTINGKKVALEVVEKNGKVFVEAQSAFKALGASVTYDKARKSFVVVTAGQNQAQAVQGTAQLAGGEGVIGKTYTLGKGEEGLNFTLKSVEYTVSRVTVGGEVYVPNADEKLIVLHYTVQNPQKQEMGINWASFKFTAVDARDTNHVGDRTPGRDGSSEEVSGLNLKPAQKIDLFSVWAVPAAGVTPKLIVERGSGNPVLRFDLRGKTTKLVAPFADPADASGATARTEVPAEAAKYYPLGNFDLKLESVGFSDGPMLDRELEEGERFLVATFSMRNGGGKTAPELDYNWSTIKVELRDADGDRHDFDGEKVKASRNEVANGKLKPGEETRFRAFLKIPKDLAVKTVYVREGESRAYAFDVSNVK